MHDYIFSMQFNACAKYKIPLSQLFLYEKLIVFVRIESTKILTCLWLDDLSIRHGQCDFL